MGGRASILPHHRVDFTLFYTVCVSTLSDAAQTELYYQLEEGLAVFGGINNLTDEEPFATQTAWPVGPRGRTLFLGVNYTM